MKSSAATTAAVGVQSAAESSFSNMEESTAQAIIDRAMATHRDSSRTKPNILTHIRQPNASQGGVSQFQGPEESDQAPAARSESPGGLRCEPDLNLQPKAASSHHLVKVKRVSSTTEKLSRKKSKIDFLSDPSSELEKANEARCGKISNYFLVNLEKLFKLFKKI